MIYLNDCLVLTGWMTLSAILDLSLVYGLDAALERFTQMNAGGPPL